MRFRPHLGVLGSAVVLALLAALSLAAFASAGAPLPKGGVAFSTGRAKHGVSLTLVTSVRDPKQILEGAAALGSQYAMSGGSLLCPKAKKSPGFKGAPFAIFGFPATELKLSGGRYGFSKTITEPGASVLGSSAKPFTLKVKVSGTVLSPTRIGGTVTASGGPCKTKKPLKYTAKLDPKLPVAPQ
jgi:hypothetical protein